MQSIAPGYVACADAISRSTTRERLFVRAHEQTNLCENLCGMKSFLTLSPVINHTSLKNTFPVRPFERARKFSFIEIASATQF